MPNQPRPDNPSRPVRVEDKLWQEAGRVTAAKGTDRSTVMREALARFVKRHGK